MEKDFFDYFKRSYIDLHKLAPYYKQEIKGIETDKNLAQATDIFKDCFGHHFHVDYNGVVDEVEVLSEKNPKLVMGNHISSYFMSNYYERPKIEQFDNGEYVDIEFDDFIEKSVLNPSYIKQNQMSTNINFLTGDTGEGKTLFCCYLRRYLHEVNKKNLKDKYSFSQKEKVIPIYLNFEQIIFKKGQNLSEITTINFKNFRKNLFDSINEQISLHLPNNTLLKAFKIYDRDPLDPENISNFTLKRFIAHLKVHHINLLFIFDNLDRYYFHYSKHIFFDNFRDTQRESINGSIGQLIDYFTTGGDNLSSVGLNVLFVTRPYVYDYLKKSLLNPLQNSAQMFRVSNNQDTVMMSRFYLYKDITQAIIKKYPNKREIYGDYFLQESFIKFTDVANDPSNNHVKTIFSIGHQKNRSFVEFLQSLHTISNGATLIERFITRKQRAIVILYILNNLKRYSQEKEHFPNIFLNDSSVCSNDVPDEFKSVYIPHMHTYWLKYFTLKIVEKEDTTLNKVLILLNRSEEGYPEELIKLALGSLNMDNEFKCIAVAENMDSKNDMMTRNITTTSRGEYLLKKELHKLDSRDVNEKGYEIEFCFNFLNLQLMIDDYLLSFPKFIFDKIVSPTLNYKYLLLKDDMEYSEGSSKMVNFKAKAVMYFIQVLKVSFEVEMSFKKDVFEKLSNEGIEFPNFKKIEKALICDIQSILKYGRMKDLETDLISSLDAIKHDKKLYKDLTKFFTKYYTNEVNKNEHKYVKQF